ncbi:PAS domain-containing protein [Lacimicrobium sp. SS2-24]|uniref:PAS domain-containing protein n=1 Tax=Lacimicrobium sp. SS2-24 TaxID=2005569 RepID=UPI000B4A9BAC|nr:PAS domain-containing protein [Lacimicrobium sp. SS2-24]
MTAIFEQSNVYTKLRDKAEAQLETGTTQTKGQWSMGVDALRLLHKLSSNPENATDALTLLHELQVHQMELDLQNEEIASNEQALVEELDLYRTIYDSAPMAYCVVDRDAVVIQANLAAAGLFGVAQAYLPGQRIDHFVNPQSRPLLRSLLQHVIQNRARDCCIAERAAGAEGGRLLQFQATLEPNSEHILLVCCECQHVT